jgi:small subunit ribosomal protein S16
MLIIRLRKMGSKKRPFFRLVVTDSRTARDSSFVEIVGHYNPRLKPAKVEIDRERIDHWIGRGARLSDTVRTLLKRHTTSTVSTAEGASASADKAAAKDATA